MNELRILNVGDAEQLTRVAGEAIAGAVLRQPTPAAGELARLGREHPALGEPMGAFVTVYVDGELRGCLGEVEPADPLVEVVVRCARRVPVYDYRFPSVRPDELPGLTFKVSVLSRPEPVGDPGAIVLGRDGLMVRHGGHIGLLLPEVPLEHGWDVAAFLKNLWRKAGISPEVPLSEVSLSRFVSQLLSGSLAETAEPKKS